MLTCRQDTGLQILDELNSTSAALKCPCDAFPQNLLSAREEKALGTVRGSALVQEAERPSRKWVVVNRGTSEEPRGHNRARGVELKVASHCLLFKVWFPSAGV